MNKLKCVKWSLVLILRLSIVFLFNELLCLMSKNAFIRSKGTIENAEEKLFKMRQSLNRATKKLILLKIQQKPEIIMSAI